MSIACLEGPPGRVCVVGFSTFLHLHTHDDPPRGLQILAASSFGGAKEGYVFKSGHQGLGYYRDGAAATSKVHARAETQAVEVVDADLDELD